MYTCPFCNELFSTIEELNECIQRHQVEIKKQNTKSLNLFIQYSTLEKGQISDGYHSFNELYQQRNSLMMAFMALAAKQGLEVWYSKKHSDGSLFPGWIIAGVNVEAGEQITLHLPEEASFYLNSFAVQLRKAPSYDGHTSKDVVDRLFKLIILELERGNSIANARAREGFTDIAWKDPKR